MTVRRSCRLTALAIGSVLVLTACSGVAAPGRTAAAAAQDDAQLQELERTQQQLTQQALDTLKGRSCIAAPPGPVLVGLPDDELACLGSGPARAPSDGDGRPTLVNLWASWCRPCVQEMPLLQETSERAGDAARFVGIDTLDEQASAASLLEATGVTYQQYDDPDGSVRTALRALGLPVTVVFDAGGREVARKVGEVDQAWLEDALGRADVALTPAG